MTTRTHPERFAWAGLSVLLLFIAWCANPWQLYFFNDDYIHVPQAASGVIGQHNMLRQVSDVSLYLNALVSGRSATGYHLTNLLLYWANILLAIPVFKKLADSLSQPVSTTWAIVAAALFGVYAFHSEALYWIICRGASLSLFFNLLSWYCFFRSTGQRIWLVPTAIFFLLGLFTYESIWVYPVWLLVWYGLLPAKGGERRKALWPVFTIWILFLAYLPLRIAATGELLGTYQANDVQQLNLLPVLGKTARLLARSFLPPISNNVLFAGLTLVVAGGLVWSARRLVWYRHNRLLWFLAAAWLIAYLPYVSLGVSTRGYESERYLYYPSLFLCALLVYGAKLLWHNKLLRLRIFVALLFAYQLFFFVKASLAFRQISRFSRAGIAAIQDVPLHKKIVITHLPAYSYGVPLFNYGFGEAVAWMVPGRDSTSVITLSKQDYGKKDIHFTIDRRNPVADTLRFTGR